MWTSPRFDQFGIRRNTRKPQPTSAVAGRKWSRIAQPAAAAAGPRSRPGAKMLRTLKYKGTTRPLLIAESILHRQTVLPPFAGHTGEADHDIARPISPDL